MASQPEVTVIIPNYNGRKLLENCIQTLERQTCTDFKLLVVDNGSEYRGDLQPGSYDACAKGEYGLLRSGE